MSYDRIALAGLIPVNFEVLTLSNSTAQSLQSTTLTGSVFDISVETNNARYRADGTAPTVNTGVVLQKDVTYRFEGNFTSVIQFQRVTGTCKISVMAYKHPGD